MSPALPPAEITDAKHRAAWEALAGGGSHSEASEAAGVARRTVARWVERWRIDYNDPDLFITEANEARHRRTEAARAERRVRWTEAKVEIERATALFTQRTIEIAAEALEHLDPKTVTPAELRHLLISFGIAVDKAQDLIGAAQRPASEGMTQEQVDKSLQQMIDDARAVAGAD